MKSLAPPLPPETPISKRQVTWMRKLLAGKREPGTELLVIEPDSDVLPIVARTLPFPLELTQRAVEKAAPRRTEYTIWDTGIHGFGLRVRPSGDRSYVLIYRPQGRRRQKRVTIGKPGVLTLREAREIARGLLGEVYKGRDPSERRRQQRAATVETVYRIYEAQHLPRRAPAYARCVQRIFERWFLPRFGDKALAEIRRSDIRNITDDHAREAPMGAINVHRAAASFLTWCVDREYIDHNPLRGAGLPAEPHARDHVIRTVDLVEIWRACEGLPEHWRVAIRILMATGLRKSEVLKAQWCEFDFEAGEWTIPPERSKNRQGHVVPITPFLRNLIEPLKRESSLLFPSPLKSGLPVVALYHAVRELKSAVRSQIWHIHDIRRSVATYMAGLGTAPHVIEAVLNHRSGVISGVAAVYNRHAYETEKRNALMRWQEHFAELLGTTPQRDRPAPKECPASDGGIVL